MSENTYELIDSLGKVINTIILDPNSNYMPPAGCTVRLFVPSENTNSSRPKETILTQLQFLRKFTVDERIRIRNSPDSRVKDFLHLLTLAQDIRLDDSDTIMGVNFLESINLLASGRAAEILS